MICKKKKKKRNNQTTILLKLIFIFFFIIYISIVQNLEAFINYPILNLLHHLVPKHPKCDAKS